MDLPRHYYELYRTSIEKIENNNYRIDRLIDSRSDNRFGISLLVRPPENILSRIGSFLEELSRIDPSQYYYPLEDIHITIMSIISCYEGFKLEKISTPAYVHLVKESIGDVSGFRITCQGITASDSGIMDGTC